MAHTGPIVKDVIVHNVAVLPQDDCSRASITLTANGKEFHAWFEIPKEIDIDQATAEQAFAFMTIGLGHAFGGVVEYPYSILPETKTSCNTLYQMLLKEGIPMQSTICKSHEYTGSDSAGKKTASFFSGGVDSMYCAEDPATKDADLFFIIGVDMRLDQHDIMQNSIAAATGFAAEVSKRIYFFRTNIKETIFNVVPWNINHGFILATVAFLCRKNYWKVFIPSSFPASIELFHGSAGFVVPHYSNRFTQLIIHAPHVFRVEKVLALTQSALKYLRCCYESDNLLNCSACEKCLRTLAILNIHGKQSSATTFKTIETSELIHLLTKLDLEDKGKEKYLRYCTWREVIDFEKNQEISLAVKNILLRTIPKYDNTSLARSLAYEIGEAKPDNELVLLLNNSLHQSLQTKYNKE